MNGDLLAVEAAPLGSALNLIKAADGVKDAAVFGNALHVVVQGAEETMGKIRAALNAGGVEVRRMAPIRPTLEDAFVALTTREGNDNSERPAPGSLS
jgi:ABC-2 type transport system ATP-binding protein